MPTHSAIQGLMVAGTHSGAGKTTAALGLMDLFRRKGFSVQPFKAGPDFIDPSLHALACGRASRNLDSFLLDAATIRHLYSKSAARADVAVIEAVGGFYDGYSGLDARGSSAEIARLTGCPVILVCDARSSARSIAAVVKGFQEFDRKARIAGVFLNRLAGQKHAQWCREAIERHCRIPVVGYLFAAEDLEMKERHMGLVPAAEQKFDPRWLAELRRQMDRHTRWNVLLRILRAHAPVADKHSAPLARRRSRPVRIGIARDKAFSFYYQDGLDLLGHFGAEMVPFSPIRDARLPKNLDGVYFGGGFPEVFGPELEQNISLRSEIRLRLRRGLPAYAECGGLMYLGESLTDSAGRRHRTVGALPYRTVMTPKIAMAYLKAKARHSNLIAKRGESFPGQVFHFSTLEPIRPLRYSYQLSTGYERFPDGITQGRVLASYMHVHFWSRPELARNFVDHCAARSPS